MKIFLSLPLVMAPLLLAPGLARAEGPCQQEILVDFAPADGVTGVPTDAVIRLLSASGACSGTIPFDDPAIELEANGAAVIIQYSPSVPGLTEVHPAGGLLPGTEYTLRISSWDQEVSVTRFTTGTMGATASSPPSFTLDEIEPDTSVGLPKSAYDFASLTITLGAGNPDLISAIQVLQVDENGAGATPAGLGLAYARPGQTVAMKVDVPVVVGQKVCFQVTQDDGAGHLSAPSATLCGTAVGKDATPPASSCSVTPRSGSGLAAAGLLALSAVALRRRRSAAIRG